MSTPLSLSSRVRVSDVPKYADKQVLVAGFVNAIRRQKHVIFVILRDHGDQLQIVYRRGSDPQLEEILDHLCEESVVAAIGTVKLDDRVNLNKVELQLTRLTVLSRAEPELPITPDSSLDKRLDWRFLDLRQPRNELIFRVQTTMLAALREWWIEKGFVEITTPKLMASPSESGAELFGLDYFGGKAYLAQSPQFYKQMAMAAGFDSVFEIGPVFRANPSFTSRHDTEFTSIDLEISWIDSHEDIMKLEEQSLRRMLEEVRCKHGEEIERLFGVEVTVPSVPFPRITLVEARKAVAQQGYEIPREQGDLDPEGERRLARHVKDHYGHDFVFVTDYPSSVRPFYHMRYEGELGLTKSFDLLWRGLEITTGAQREHRYDVLLRQVRQAGINETSLAHYLNFFRFGCPPHGGLGLGMTRLLMILLNVATVREVTYLYRGPNRLTP